MMSVNIIHTNGGFTTLLCPTAESYGVAFAELSEDPTYTFEGIERKGAVFREVKE